LPPDLLFAINVVGKDGQVLASTRSTPTHPEARLDIQQGPTGDALWVDIPRRIGNTGEWTLRFGRALLDADGTVTGAVILAVDASYFVSGYEPSLLVSRVYWPFSELMAC